MAFDEFWYSSGAAGGGGGDPGDPIGESLRGRGPGTGRLARTPAAAGNRQTYTISFWLKYAGVSNSNYLYAAERFQANTSSDVGHFGGNAGAHDPATNISWRCGTTRFRDPSAWYHWVFVGDTTNATEADRIRFYINGERITISGTNLITQNYNTGWNAAVTTTIFDAADTSDAGNNNLQGCIADFYNMDGLALEPECFGRSNADGVWVPRTGSRQDLATPREFNADDYGVNGFHLTFADPDDLGADTAPIGATGHTAANDFTPSGFDTDPVGIFSNQLFTAPSNATIPVDPTDQDFNTTDAGFEQSDAFDGDDSTGALSDEGGGSWIQFRPEDEITATTSLSVRCQTVQTIAVNGTDTTLSQTADSLQTVNLSAQLTFPIDIATISIRGNGGNNPRLCTIIVDGTEITDNTGEDYDLMDDSPTQNYATLNPLGAGHTASDANLTFNVNNEPLSTIGMPQNSGRFYMEFGPLVCGTGSGRGVALQTLDYNNAVSSSGVGNWRVYTSNPTNVAILQGDTGVWTEVQFFLPNSGIWQIAYDSDTGEAWFGIDGQFYDSDFNETTVGTNPTWGNVNAEVFARARIDSYDGGQPWSVNFGQKPFLYQPDGWRGIQTQNLPAATIANGRDHFGVITYAGNNDQQREITGLEFAPDFVWIKQRDGASTHSLQDTVRGAGANSLRSDSNLAEGAGAAGNGFIDRFDANGFRLNRGTAPGERVNQNGSDYVAWCWRAGGAAVTNDDGDIESQVSANTDAGFSIVSYTGVNPAATIGHGLNQAPEFIIVKNRDDSRNWTVLHTGVGTNGNSTFFGADDYNMLQLNTSDEAQTFSADLIYPDPDNNGTTFGVGNAAQVNGNGDDMIAYCWHSVPGYSAFGSYTGNGDDDGPFIYTGFRPAFVMTKRTDSSTGGNWVILDSSRNLSNPTNHRLFPNSSNSETDDDVDFLSNGFKQRQAGGTMNQSSGNYIYCAFAENPFQSPVTAR